MIILACDKCKVPIRAPSDYIQFDYTTKIKHNDTYTEIKGMREYYCMECWSKMIPNLGDNIIRIYGLGPVVILKRYMSDDHCPNCGE